MKKLIKNFPPLPDTIIQIEKLNKDKDSSFNEYVKIIERDPLLTTMILKKANSPFYGFSRKLNSIHQIVSLFGKGAIRGMVLASFVSKNIEVNFTPYDITSACFQETALLQNALAINWAKKSNPELNDSLSAASFLIDIGKLLISRKIIEDKDNLNLKELTLAESVIPNLSFLEEIEKKYTQTTTSEVSSLILDKWFFDENVIDIIKNVNNPENAQPKNFQASAILHVIRSVVLIDGKISEESLANGMKMINKYELDPSGFEKAILLI